MRLTYLSTTDISEECPDEFRQYSKKDVQACGQPNSSEGCYVGITFLSNTLECVS